MPKGEKATTESKDFYDKMPFQSRIFADVESISKTVDEPIQKGSISKHRPAAYAFPVKIDSLKKKSNQSTCSKLKHHFG